MATANPGGTIATMLWSFMINIVKPVWQVTDAVKRIIADQAAARPQRCKQWGGWVCVSIQVFQCISISFLSRQIYILQ